MRKISELMSLQGRVALVTGGTGHIGTALAEALAELGAAIVVVDIVPERCATVCKTISSEYGVVTLPLAIDLANEILICQLPAAVAQEFGRLDILVNCAAFVGTSNLTGWAVPFEEQSVETWCKAIEVNLTAPFVLSKACTPLLRESKHGTIINIASIYGIVGPDMRLYDDTKMGNPAAYASSKGGLIQLTRWLSTVLAPDIRVNAITPGGVTRGQPKIFQNRYVARTPLNRMAIEEDFKGAVAYLASDLSKYVTGQNLVVDGGFTTV
jgi:NAD(P)-dependent dehydrogenase (short-subunit alcohol dehydrogenase family)